MNEVARSPRRWRDAWWIAFAACALALVACGSSTPSAPAQTAPGGAAGPDAGTMSASPTAAAMAAAPSFPTGPAVTVPVDYTPPTDRVDSTGAYLPANGKPTLVFVDAIW